MRFCFAQMVKSWIDYVQIARFLGQTLWLLWIAVNELHVLWALDALFLLLQKRNECSLLLLRWN
jgi:hypothetical protein